MRFSRRTLPSIPLQLPGSRSSPSFDHLKRILGYVRSSGESDSHEVSTEEYLRNLGALPRCCSLDLAETLGQRVCVAMAINHTASFEYISTLVGRSFLPLVQEDRKAEKPSKMHFLKTDEMDTERSAIRGILIADLLPFLFGAEQGYMHTSISRKITHDSVQPSAQSRFQSNCSDLVYIWIPYMHWESIPYSVLEAFPDCPWLAPPYFPAVNSASILTSVRL